MTYGASDDGVVLTSKLKTALNAYDAATRKYLSAVKELEASVSNIAVAVRQLSCGDVDADLRLVVDRFCSSIDAHGSTSKRKSASVSSTVSGNHVDVFASGSAIGAKYDYTSYVSDFSHDVTASLQALKTVVKESEGLQKQWLDAKHSLAKVRTDADKREAKLAKQNRNIADDAKFAKLTTKRTQLTALADSLEKRCSANYATVLQQRSELLRRILATLGTCSHRYYSGLADVMKTSAG